MAPLPLFVLSCLAHLLLLSSAEEKHPSICPPFQCGTREEFKFQFPFKNNTSPECGLYTINCSGPVPKIQLKEGGHWYEIEQTTYFHDYINIKGGAPSAHFSLNICDPNLESYALPSPSMISNLSTPFLLTVFNYSHSPSNNIFSKDFHHSRCGDYDIYYTLSNSTPPFPHHCSMIQLPGYIDQTRDHKIEILPSFTLDVNVSRFCYKCHGNKGHCQTNYGQDTLYCVDQRKGHLAKVVVLVLIAAVAGSVILIVSVCCLMKKFSSERSILFWKKQMQTQRNIEAFLKHYGPLQARRYSYSDVKKMTKSFKKKLGQGGFGSVYKGRLHDGGLVAVKVLDESKADGEEFINEVVTISRTSHVNVVSLLGFCFEGAKSALIYEFMPNGSLEKFVFDHNATENSQQLDWEMYYQISLGIARGLEYLHRGCKTRILHFDIKPHNILLDADFVPKISDFGLARICTRKESLISMLGPRGTIGYIAPEVVSRNFGGISHKSDVYSYGMMVLEIVGGRKNVNIKVENTSEIYFPHWIYKRLELDEELGLKRIINEGDRAKVRKMIIVSLWCIQTNPSNRPTMSKVIEMLEGTVESLPVPPKPFLYSPPGSPPVNFSATSELL